MKRWVMAIAAAVGALLMVGCQAVFTYSPLSGLARSPSQMSTAEVQQYATQALASGDPAAMTNAYDAIKGSTDPGTQLLAAQLAFGGSGATQVFNQVLGAIASNPNPTAADLTSLTTQLQSALNSVNVPLAADGATALTNAAAGGATVTDSQYAMGAAALVASAAKQAGGLQNLQSLAPGSPGYQTLQDAQQLASNIQSSAVSQLLKGVL